MPHTTHDRGPGRHRSSGDGAALHTLAGLCGAPCGGNRSGYVVKTGITPQFATSDRGTEAEKGRFRHAERPHGRR